MKNEIDNEKNLGLMLASSPVTIGRELGFDKLEDLHNKWILKMLHSVDDLTIQAHRGSYKTTCLSIFLSLHTVLEPNENIIMLRKSDTDVAEVLNAVYKMLESDLIRQIVKEICGKELEVLKATNSEIHTNLATYTKGTSQIIGLGLGSSITGKHADVIITDDIVNVKDRASKAERKRTILAYMELQNIKNRGGRIINLGTPWHVEDAFSLMPNIEKYDCYSTGLMSNEEIRSIRESMTDSLFAANYELKHIADEDALFKNPKWETNTELIYGGQMHIDASYGGADGTAMTVLNFLKDGRIIGYGRRWDKHVDDCKGEILMEHERLRAGSVFTELNADKGYLTKDLRAEGLNMRPYHERTNKFVKISTHLKKYWKDIYWLEDTDKEYMQEILDYTEFAEHDDSPDSAASLIRAITKIKDNFSFD